MKILGKTIWIVIFVLIGINANATTANYSVKNIGSPLKNAKLVKSFGKVKDLNVSRNYIVLQAQKDKTVRSVLAGKVIFVGDKKGVGKIIILSHTNKLYTIYFGLSKIASYVKKDIYVKKATILGKVKNMLKFQVRRGDLLLNPSTFLDIPSS